MRKFSWLLSLFIAVPLLAAAGTQQSPYAGQEGRPIKALSAEEVQSYLTGQGMGLAKAAELNSYPGPKHVLELAGQLQLTGEQLSRAEKARADMLAEATRLAGSSSSASASWTRPSPPARRTRPGWRPPSARSRGSRASCASRTCARIS